MAEPVVIHQSEADPDDDHTIFRIQVGDCFLYGQVPTADEYRNYAVSFAAWRGVKLPPPTAVEGLPTREVDDGG